MFAAAPLMVLPVVAYNLLAVWLGGGFYARAANVRLTAPIFQLATAGGGAWPISAADLLLAAALLVLFVELIKAARGPRLALVNHGLSLIVFVACLAEMLISPAFATSTFFLIALMVLFDVLAGFLVVLGGQRRSGAAA